MTDEKNDAIEEMRNLYLREYARANRNSDRIAFFEDIREKAVASGATAWEKFADASACHVREDMEAALSLFGEVIALDPKFAHPWNGKGNVFNQLKRYEEALAAYDKAVALDPKFAYPWNGKGNVLDNLKRYEEALAAYDKAVALDPKFAYPWNGKGNVLGNLERYEEALEAFDKAIALDPEYANAWNGKGTVLSEQKRYEEALEAFDKAVALDPELAAALYNLGVLHWKRKRPEDAVKAFRRVIALGTKPEWKVAVESWIERASQMIESEKAGTPPEELEQEDRSSDEALITDLFEAMKEDLPGIRKKKRAFKERMADSVGKPRIVGEGAADDMLLVLRDWNSYSPILRVEVRDQEDPGPDERLGGGYFLAWKGHGIVIDPGVDFVTQLYRKGLSIADVDTVVVTHCHLDHTRDLESLVDLNYRYNRERTPSRKPPDPKFRHLAFKLGVSAYVKYREYLIDSQCCLTPTQLDPEGGPWRVSEYIDLIAIPVRHYDINGRDNEAIGLVFVLKDETGEEVLRVGLTSDSRWLDSLPGDFKDCDVLVAHLGTIEVGDEEKKPDGDGKEEEDGGGFLKTNLKNHLGTKGCFRLLQDVKPTIFVVGEFGEELVETRFKMLRVLSKLKPTETRFVLGGDSNLVVGLGKELEVLCSHPECARFWRRIAMDKVHVVLGGDFLFQYNCSEHEIAD